MQAFDDEGVLDAGSEASNEEETTTAPASIKFIHDRGKRRSTFKKRKGGLMKKAYELSQLTGMQVLVLAVSESGMVYSFASTRLQSLISQPEGKNLIQACLNTPPGALARPTILNSNAPQAINSQPVASTNARPDPDASHSLPGTDCGMNYTKNDSLTDKIYVRSEQFWLPDGNIILSTKFCESPNDTDPPRFILFRVHKSTLARQSEVFEHMFGTASLPDGESAMNEMYDGLPVVEMPDSREHLCGLLEVLYGGISLPYKQFDPRAGDTACLVLEIATKYEMENIRQRVIAHIEDYWPTSLAAWDIFETRLQVIEDDERRDDEMDCYAQEPAAAIALARRFDIRGILPAVFYDLSRIPASCDLTLRESRAEDAPDDEVDSDTWNVRAARWSVLSVPDYHRVCVARERLRAKAVHAVGRALHSRPTKGCYNVTRCRDQSVKAQAETREKCYSSYDVLKVLKEATERVAVCPPCREEIRNELQMCRREIWRDLPMTFFV